MGNCSSTNSTQVATAKLILQDGTLQEFSYPVKVSYVLQKNSACFICNSDEMDFDNVVTAVNDDEELQLGQLYFALPLNRLKHKLQPDEMAALAVKASAALMKSGGEKCGCRRNSVLPVLFFGEGIIKSSRKACGAGNVNGGLSRERRRRGTGKFTAMLSAIPE